jgi:hypothetical protein
MPRSGWRAQYAAEAAAVREELRSACPFSEPSVEAFARTMPSELNLLATMSNGLVNPQRLWATFLCRSFLRGKNEHFLVKVRGESTTSVSSSSPAVVR